MNEQITLNQAGVEPSMVNGDDILHILLTWTLKEPLDRDYKLFVHVADADGRPLAQWDGLPHLNTAQTSLWPVGEPIRDHVLVPVTEDIPPGQYQILAGLYDGESGERLGGSAVPIANLRIE